MKYLFSILSVIVVFICLPKDSFAATTVNNVQQLKDEIDSANSLSDIVISESFDAPEKIELDITKAKKIIIQGPKKKLISNFLMNVNINSANSSEKLDLNMKGFQFDGEKKKQVGISVQGMSNIKVDLNVEDSTFENSTSSVLTYNPEADFALYGNVNLTEIYVHNNESSNGGIVNIRGADGGMIEYTSFKNNINSSTKTPGALALVEVSDISINYSYFVENEYTSDKGAGGGAIYSSSNSTSKNYGASLDIFSSYFTNNKSLKSKGGAIYFKEDKGTAYLSLTNNVLRENISKEGGAVYFEGKSSLQNGSNNRLKVGSSHCMYFSNKSIAGGGGGVQIEFQIPNNREVFASQNDVFYKNSATFNNKPVKGGAINIKKNNMRISSSILGYNIGEKNFENIFVENNSPYVQKKSLGIDNGKDISGMSEKIFGKYPIELIADYNDKFSQIGSKKYKALPVWLPIIPNVSDKEGNQLTGFAITSNNSINNNSELLNSDLGIEMISSLLYDANGGNYNLPELNSYNGDIYYEGSKPKYYSEANRINRPYFLNYHTIKDAKKDLNIERKGYTFLGWSTKHDAKTANIQLDPGTTIQVLKQRKLFAIWQPNTYQLTYYGTSKSSGTTPAVTKAKYNTTATIKSAGTMKRKGHKFLGWSTKANQTTAKYVAGKKMKVTSSLKLYPVWKANKYTLKYNNTSKTSGAAPKSVSATYGKSYTIKNAGTMKRKGYKFLGWSKKAKQTKVDAKLKPGKKIKVLGTTNLYPVWKKAK